MNYIIISIKKVLIITLSHPANADTDVRKDIGPC